MTDAESNLKRWLRTHMLPPHFPELRASDAKDGLFLRDDGQEVRRLLDAIQGSPRTLAIFPPGQGASTVLGEVLRIARSSTLRLPQLFIVVDPVACHMDDEGDFGAAMNRAIRTGLVEQLVHGYWENALYGDRRARLFDLLDLPDSDALDEIRYGLQSGGAEAERAQARLTGMADRFEESLLSLVAELHRGLNLSTFLVMDFPHDCDDDVLRDAMREIKWFDENDKPDDFPAAALTEVYLLSRRQADFITSMWQRDYNRAVFPPYNEAEVFAIMASHFQPKTAGKTVPLGSVLSQDFVKRVWAEDKPLARMMAEMREEILKSLDVPLGRVQYQLRPVDQPRP